MRRRQMLDGMAVARLGADLLARRHEQPNWSIRQQLCSYPALMDEAARELLRMAREEAQHRVQMDQPAPDGDDVYSALVRRYHAPTLEQHRAALNRKAEAELAKLMDL
ncbi:MAG TPA: hypothetical protein VFS21_29875 [Roseiflexaceae bacterium]|nr:hypothetical protein [Roseiflexaceae bacterium]